MNPLSSPAALALSGPASRPARRTLSLRLNFGWALLGNLVFQFCQWLILVILAKSAAAEVVGDFGLAVAICTPVTILTGLCLASVQVTDARDDFAFGHYLALRLLSASVGLALITGLALASPYAGSTRLLVVLVGAGQAVLMLREVFTAYLQKHERMDLVSRSNMAQGGLSLLGFSAGLWLGGGLLGGVLGLLAGRLLTWLLWDVVAVARLAAGEGGGRLWLRPRWHWPTLWNLAWVAAPLGLNAGLLSFNTNLPRYFIERGLGKEALGYFVAILALPAAGVLIVQAAGASATPRLTRYYLEDRAAFVRLLGRLLLLAAALGGAGLLVVALVGRPMLALVFRPAYAAYHGLFLWLMFQAALAYAAGFLGYAMTATRQFVWQLPVNALVIATTAGAAAWLVPAFGLRGAALSAVAGTAVQVAALALAVRRLLRRPIGPGCPGS